MAAGPRILPLLFGTVEALFGGGVTTSTTNPIQTEMMLWWNLIRVYQTEKIAKKKRVLTALFQGRTEKRFTILDGLAVKWRCDRSPCLSVKRLRDIVAYLEVAPLKENL